MNPDPRLNCCAALEEDHASYDRMARKVGIKYVMSMLNEGTLVWAKMAGYCRFVYYMYRVAFKGEIVSFYWSEFFFSFFAYYILNFL